jgi:hypothetical protein
MYQALGVAATTQKRQTDSDFDAKLTKGRRRYHLILAEV